MCATNRYLHESGERKENKVSLGRTMIQPLELLRLAKKRISGQSNIKQWRNQACSLGIIKLCLSEGISQIYM